ncbi:MAG: alpha/beta hydrolase [Bacteroidota bacterium]|nr:alpha/beta hydrolase [Bacteroidota bacterium]
MGNFGGCFNAGVFIFNHIFYKDSAINLIYMIKAIVLYFLLFQTSTKVSAQTEEYAPGVQLKTYFRTFGTGKPLLIINGGPGMNSDGFVTLAKTLSKNHQTIIYDQRGTGKSVLKKTDSATITMRLMAEDLEQLRSYLKIEKWSVLGHSFGGMLASYYATLHPDKIEALILSSSGGVDLELLSYVDAITSKLTQGERDSLAYWNSRISTGDTSYATRLGRGRSLAPAYLYDRKNIPVIAERLTQGNSLVNNLVWNNLRTMNFDCKKALASFDKPVLIIQGKQDIIEEKTGQKAHQLFKNSKLVLLDKCGHYGWLDRPDKYLPEVENFLAAH